MDLAAPGPKAIDGEGGGSSPSDPFRQYVTLRGSDVAPQGGTLATTGGVRGVGGTAPKNGYMIGNNSSSVIMVQDNGTPSISSGFPVQPGTIFITPPGYTPLGAVEIWTASNGETFEYRGW
jgi:hypothetical protein